MSVRDSVIEELRRVVGNDVHIIPAQDSADVLDRKTIMLKQQTIAPLPEAQRGALRIDYILTFIAPGQDPTTAEAELDEWVPSVLDDLNHLNWFVWVEASKVLFSALNFAYDVTCYVTTTTTNNSKE